MKNDVPISLEEAEKYLFTDSIVHEYCEQSLPAEITTEGLIHSYFVSLEDALTKYHRYMNVAKEIDFLKMRRFLFTAFNNIREIDFDLMNTELKLVFDDLNQIIDIYAQFKQRVSNVKKAFHELFLSKHDEFVMYERKLNNNLHNVVIYEGQIKIAEAGLKKLTSKIKLIKKDSEEYMLFESKMKSFKKKSVEAVHNKRILEDENIILAQYLQMIIDENEESFREKFIYSAKIFNQKIVLLLNKTAYNFDVSLWKYANQSKLIQKHFEYLNNKNLSSSTYLKHYLKSLNHENLSEENLELLKLVPYIDSLEQHSILYFYDNYDTSLRIRKILTALTIKIELKPISNLKKVHEYLKEFTPHYIFADFSSDYKSLIRLLRGHNIADKVILVLLADKVTDIIDERAKQFHIDYILGVRITTHKLMDKFMEILQN